MKTSKCTLKIGQPTTNDHQCTVTQEGDWVVFRCPHCKDYERRFNSKTGDMKTKGTQGNTFKHHGNYVRPGFDTGLYHPN